MTKRKSFNILSRLPDAREGEIFKTLAKGRGFKIERIISRGQATPEGKWLCSKTAEWVAVLQGRAHLRFKGARQHLDLGAGDCVFIPAHSFHRVDWTHPRQKTVWLAVHLETREV